MTVKNSKLRPTIFTDLATRCPAVSFEALEFMIEQTKNASDARQFQLVKAYEIIALTFKMVPEIEKKEDKVHAHLAHFTESLVSTLEKASSNSELFSSDRLKSILKSLGVIIRRCKSSIPDRWDVSPITAKLESMPDQKNAGVKALIKQLCLSLK